jgi:hypothetical protein
MEELNNLTTFGEPIEFENDEWSFDVTFEFIVHGILINSVGVLGLLGNVVSIVVLSRPQMKSSINTLLIGLVGCDSLLIITSIFMFCFTVFRYTGSQFFQDYYWRVYPYVVPFVYPVALMAQTGSAYLTLAVTIERYLVTHSRLIIVIHQLNSFNTNHGRSRKKAKCTLNDEALLLRQSYFKLFALGIFIK